jgi:aspartyl-tRNA(Asn)/glutamyl-tRNA(Gln) amidotransferase subunit B
MSDLLRYLYENNLEIQESKVTPKKLVEMIHLIDKGVISGKIAKKILPKIITTGKTPLQIIREEDMVKITNRKLLNDVIEKVFTENQKATADALTNNKAVNFLIGQVMRATEGKADPYLTKKMINEKLHPLK